MALSGKRARFVAEYCVDLNATQAAIRAGYSPRSARVTGSRLLMDADIQAAIASAEEARLAELGIRHRAVLEELARAAYSDIGNVMRWSDQAVHFTPSEELSPDVRRTVAGISVKRRRIVLGNGGDGGFGEWELEEIGVKLWDKLRALELIGKRLGMWTDKVEHAGEIGIREYVGVDVEKV